MDLRISVSARCLRVLCVVDWDDSPLEAVELELELEIDGDRSVRRVTIDDPPPPWTRSKWFPWEDFKRLTAEASGSPGCP